MSKSAEKDDSVREAVGFQSGHYIPSIDFSGTLSAENGTHKDGKRYVAR